MIELPKLELPREPYRGIEPFRFIDRPIFFERRDETRRLIRLVSIYRGTLLYGESGTGKSSVINAGFIPAMLEEGFLPERLRVQPLPGGELVVERLALTDEGTAPFLPSRFAAEDEPRTRLVFSTEDLRGRLTSEHPGGPPLLIFDQFEEFITLFEEAPEGREKFAEATQAQKTLLDFFHSLLRDETLPVKLLFVFREDYLAKLSKLFALVPNLRDQNIRLTFPNSSVLKRLIRGPFTLSDIPPEHFGRVISDELANKMCAALEERSETGSINLTEVQIACLSLWRDPEAESLFDATPNRAEVIQRLLEGHLTGALDRLSSGLREPAVAVLRHLVTSAGTRNIVLESDLLERLRTSENIPGETGKRALAELSGQSRLVRRQRRNEAYFYDIMSEFLVPWIQRQRALSDARIALRKWRRRVGIGLGVAGAIVGTLAVVAILIYKEHERHEDELAKTKLEDETRIKEELQRAFKQNADLYQEQRKIDGVDTQQRAIDSVRSKEEVAPETLDTARVDEPETPGDGPDAPSPAAADVSRAVDYITDKLFVGHRGAVWNVHYSAPPIGVAFPGKSDSYCITAGRDQTARVWDWKGDNDFALRGHGGEVNDARFNPQPRSEESWFAATASDDTTVGLWKVKEPERPTLLRGHREAVTGLAWSNDGSWLVSTSKDKDVRIWNVAGDPARDSIVLAGHTDKVWLPFLVEGDGKGWLVTPSADGTARLWNFPGGQPASFSGNSSSDREVLRHGAPVRRVAMDSNARWIVTAGADERAKLWDRVTGRQLLSIRHGNDVADVAFEPKGPRFVTASADNTAQVWNAETGQGIVTLQGHTGPIFSARFTHHGPGVVTVSWDQTARLWNYETKKCIAVLRGHSDVLWSVEFSPLGHAFVTTSGDGTARLWPLNRIPGGAAFMPVRAGAK
jgi:WD40 repeat protein